MTGSSGKRGTGWIGFAGTLLLISGAFMVIDGASAVSGSTFFVQDAKFVFADLNTWGWIFIILGAFKVAIGAGVFTRNTFAVSVAIIIASIGVLGELLAAPRYPFWSLAGAAIDLLVIYGLYNYGLDDD